MVTKDDIAKWHVLVVDDDADSREVVTLVLNFNGATVYAAKNGLEAIEILKKIKPDLVLLDLSMPVMDGWETLERIRNELNIKDVPVIALTAHAMTGDRERGLDAGFNNYITKPLDLMTFLDHLLTGLNAANNHHTPQQD